MPKGDKQKTFQFKTAEQLTEMSERCSNQVIRLQETGMGKHVNFDETFMQAGFEIAAQLSGIRAQMTRMNELLDTELKSR
jgi:hypothetical protein